MNIEHHPDDMLLTAFAAGTLDQGRHIAVATHLFACARCRGWAGSMERVGGEVLANLPPTAMSGDALARLEARLDERSLDAGPAPSQAVSSDIPGLPGFVRRYPMSDWIWIAPSLHMRRIFLPKTEETRVFFLRSSPGTKLLPHAHTGIEMTCVLAGSFDHDGAHYGAGDFDMGDPDVDHEISIGPNEVCISLVALQGALRLKGVLGRIMQPFVSL